MKTRRRGCETRDEAFAMDWPHNRARGSSPCPKAGAEAQPRRTGARALERSPAWSSPAATVDADRGYGRS